MLTTAQRQKQVLAHSLAQQAGAALFYAVSSLLVIFLNKMVLSSYHFPSYNFVALMQFTATVIVMWVLKLTGRIQVSRSILSVFARSIR